MWGFVDSGTITVEGKPRIVAAETQARPALPPDEV
jgi:hypothetical protein